MAKKSEKFENDCIFVGDNVFDGIHLNVINATIHYHATPTLLYALFPVTPLQQHFLFSCSVAVFFPKFSASSRLIWNLFYSFIFCLRLAGLFPFAVSWDRFPRAISQQWLFMAATTTSKYSNSNRQLRLLLLIPVQSVLYYSKIYTSAIYKGFLKGWYARLLLPSPQNYLPA